MAEKVFTFIGFCMKCEKQGVLVLDSDSRTGSVSLNCQKCKNKLSWKL